MRASRKLETDRRLEAYFAALRPSSMREVLKRSAANWQFYAAVTGSAMAMATSATANAIGSGIPNTATDRMANTVAATQRRGTSGNLPFTNAIRLAMAQQDSRRAYSRPAGAQNTQASPAQGPSISPGGVVPNSGIFNLIEPGEWISIYGNNLASGTVSWNGDFPTSLGGTKVEINGKPAYLMFVSPGQINLQAPDDTARGTVSVVVTTAGGTATSTVTLSDVAPSFSLVEVPSPRVVPAGEFGYVSGIIIRSDGSGAYGGGAYDLLGPTGASFGYSTVAAKAGDIVELYGVGFGPTTPIVPAGQVFAGAAPINEPFTLYINNISVKPSFVGLSSAGLYQINLTVPPGLGEGDVPLQAMVAGMATQQGVLFSLESTGSIGTGTFGTVGPGPGTFGPGPGSFGPGPSSFGPGPASFGPGSGSIGPGSSGARGGGAGRKAKKHYRPKLKFPPQ